MLKQDEKDVGPTCTATLRLNFFDSDLCDSLQAIDGEITGSLLEKCKDRLYTQCGKIDISGEVIKETVSTPAQTSAKSDSLYTIFIPLNVDINTSHFITIEKEFLFFYLFEQTYDESCIFQDSGSGKKNGKAVKTDVDGVAHLFTEPQKETDFHAWYLYHIPKYLSLRLSYDEMVSCERGMVINFDSDHIYCTHNW